MKRSRTRVNRAMHISRFGEPHFAELPLCFGRRSGGALKPQVSIGKRDHDVVVPVDMPQSRFAGRNGDIPDAHELVFEFWMVMSFTADFDRRLRRVGLGERRRMNGSEYTQSHQ